MYVLVTYDIKTTDPEGRRRLRHAAKICADYGQRVQDSVFELKVEPARWVECRERLLGLIDLAVDSVRFYFLGADPSRRVEHHGVTPTYDIDGPLIV
jgi:CRISPR-associated protein Cas2